jgi:hypothetical protein
MPSRKLGFLSMALALSFALEVHAQDLHIRKNISVGGYTVSTTETSLKGARMRDVSQTPAGSTVTIRQCDLHRTLTINEQAQTYFQQDDPVDAGAAAKGAPVPDGNAGKIDVTTTLTDTGERKTMFGLPARHLKAKVVEESSANACSQVHQTFEIDGWYADLGKQGASCSTIAPPVQQAQGCQDTIVEHHSGSGKPGYPLSQSFEMAGPDGKPTTISIAVAEVSKQPLEQELFEAPKDYKQVSSLAELRGIPDTQAAGNAGTAPGAQQTPQGMQPGMPPGMQPGNAGARPSAAQMLNPITAPATGMAMQQKALSQMQAMGGGTVMGPGGMTGPSGMPGMNGAGGNRAPSTAVAAPQALGPKAPGKIRVGVAPPDAQMGQGSKSGADYSTPIRNAMVALMSGPAVEIAALDAHIPLQLQAEAQQKECDYILYSAVAVTHSSGGGGFGGFLKKAAPIASMTPMGGMARGMGGAVAASAASAAASAAAQSAQQQAMSQLAGFNGEIKSKDDVTVQYQLVATGQTAPVSQNTLQGKAKSDGEDVLTPLLQQAATTVLTQVATKK